MSPRLRFYAGVFLLTGATLMLELIQTRILSVVAWYHLAFFVISIAMFGMTAGAVWVYLRRDRFGERTLSHDLATFTAAFALSTAVSLAAQMTLVPVVTRTITSLVSWLELAVCLAVPFFFSGVAVSLALTRSPFPVGRVYGVDLVGAATGCLGVLLLLNRTDGPSAVLFSAALAAAGAWLFAGSEIGAAPARRTPVARLVGRPGLLAAALAACALGNGATEHGLRPLVVKGTIEGQGDSVRYTEWNSFSRVAVFDTRTRAPILHGSSPALEPDAFRVDQRFLNIDGDAGTVMYDYDGDAGFLRYDVTNFAYFLPGLERAAVIGVGGGRDMLSAWTFGIRDVTGVEINPIFVKLLTRQPGYVDYAGLRDLDGMRFFVDEARSWFARTDERFDVIQMSMIDTWAATGAGAFTLSENGLYTVEAWKILLSRLTPEGVFTVSRWHSPGEEDETGRMVGLAAATLFELGAAEPRRHIFLVSTGRVATLVVSRRPLGPERVRALERAADTYRYRVFVTPSAEPDSEILREIVAAPDRATLERVTAGRTLDLTPPTDDRPFFFNQLPFSDPVEVLRVARASLGGRAKGGVIQGNLVATATLMVLFAVALGLVATTIVVPLAPGVRDVGRRLVGAGTAYFLLIGVGFMTVEIGLLQRTSVFLGHPIYSLAVVLFTLILASGAGSFASDALPLDRPARFVAWAALTGGYVLALPLWLPEVLHAFEGATTLVRALLCVGVIVPAGLLMGFGFPTGMRLISAVDPTPTPWFWGINGAAGVLAAIVAAASGIAFGISTTLALGAACYLLLIPAGLAIGFRAARAG